MRVISHRYSGEAQKQCHSVSVSTPTYPVRWLTEDISGVSVGARKRGKVQGQPEGALYEQRKGIYNLLIRL